MLASELVERVMGDLLPMDVEPDHDRHTRLLRVAPDRAQHASSATKSAEVGCSERAAPTLERLRLFH